MKKKYNILGIGKAGYNIAKQFEQFSSYNVLKIDTEERKEKKYYRLQKQSSIIDYENNTPDVQKTFFKNLKGDILVIIGGSGDISGSILSFLKQIKERCQISILYIKPDTDFLSQMKYKQHEIVYNVLQQYARSGVFEQMLIFDNEKMMKEQIIEFDKKYNMINEHLVYCYHMINSFNHIESLENNFENHIETAKIVSLGYTIFNKGEIKENMFFELDNVREKRYYYSMSEETLKNDKDFYKRIKEMVKLERNRSPTTRISYGIYKTSYQEDYVFFESRSSEIQK